MTSALFGPGTGALAGPVADAPGKVDEAGGGTLFLDEVGDLGAGAQARLLRFLHNQTYERLGEVRERKADVRVIAATNRAPGRARMVRSPPGARLGMNRTSLRAGACSSHLAAAQSRRVLARRGALRRHAGTGILALVDRGPPSVGSGAPRGLPVPMIVMKTNRREGQ